MPNSRLSKARSLLQQAKALHNQIQENIRTRNFGNDDVCMKTYNDLTAVAASLFPEDPILNGQMVIMPDANLKMYSPQYGGLLPITDMPIELPSQRTKEHLARIISRLEIVLEEEPTQQPLDERDFMFVADQKLREVLILDFIEAQKAFNAEAYKACGLLRGGLIEGMLLDIVQRPSVVSEEQLYTVAKKLNLPRKKDQSLDWDRVSMTNLLKMSNALGLVGSRVLNFTEGARDTRDTVHPRAEVRQGSRVSREEASMLLELVKLIYNDLVAKFGEGKAK